MDSINTSSQNLCEGQARSENHHHDPIEDFRRDVRSLVRVIGVSEVRQLGSVHLSRDQFQAEACTDTAAAEQHLLAIYAHAGRRRGKIRQVVCRAIAERLSGKASVLR